MKTIILYSIIVCGCAKAQAGTVNHAAPLADPATPAHVMTCVGVVSDSGGPDLQRCENDEVICYSASNGISCIKKG